jgi:DNA-binding CsgD family transcriptional regulator
MATFAVSQTLPSAAPTREAELVRFIGSLCAATSLEQLERRFLSGFVRFGPALADSLPGVLGETIDRIKARDRLERQRADAIAALDLACSPIVVGDPEPRPNASAARLLAELADPEEALGRLLARPAPDGAIARRIDVELADGEDAILHATVTPLASRPGGVVAVLELRREQPGIPPGALAPLTQREAEVAVLIAEGLADREIAQRLYLSHHTVSQYVKRIYRKLDVDGRVGLTRHLLGAT